MINNQKIRNNRIDYPFIRKLNDLYRKAYFMYYSHKYGIIIVDFVENCFLIVK